ncbi:hypothetical protein P9B03_14970 [Metasolibacillus meyeri]|uniref:Lipoprotein n=1 Tax=Metasolibacillus meyeri TaxID=1071052 RepID=A0AAW9NWC4_9BACL|nr:hypothetical protein [Metasolibacillus meyeri]MEC1179799.1 hypothetical protein [Metasolibacillus meyeri]
MKKLIFLMLVTILFLVGCQEQTAVELTNAPKKVVEVIQPDLALQGISTTKGISYVIYRTTGEVKMSFVEENDEQRLYLTETESDSEELKTYIYKIPKIKSKAEDKYFSVYINDEVAPFDMVIAVEVD